jgi:hypothetical protein
MVLPLCHQVAGYSLAKATAGYGDHENPVFNLI